MTFLLFLILVVLFCIKDELESINSRLETANLLARGRDGKDAT